MSHAVDTPSPRRLSGDFAARSLACRHFVGVALRTEQACSENSQYGRTGLALCDKVQLVVMATLTGRRRPSHIRQ